MDQRTQPKGRAGLKFALLVFLLAALALLVKFTPLGDLMSRERLALLLEETGAWAPALYILLYTVFTLFAFPGVVLTIAGALVFGALPATLYIMVGATLGASGAFYMARLLGRDFVSRFLRGGRLKEFDEGIERHGLKLLLVMRLIPLFPFNGINFGAGLSRVRFRDYFIATVVGIAPGTFAYCYLTAATQRAAGRGWRSFLSPDFLLPLALFLLLVVVLPLTYKKLRRGRGLPSPPHKEPGGAILKTGEATSKEKGGPCMRKDSKFGISDKRGRVTTSADPYRPEEGLKETSVCTGCHALYRNKRWYLDVQAFETAKDDVETHWVTCPACRKIAEHYPEGVVTLSGEYVWNHEEEIRNILRNEENKAMAKNPLERIMRMEREGEELLIETTEQKLAEHLGRALHKAHQGDLEVSWTGDHSVCRVRWERVD